MPLSPLDIVKRTPKSNCRQCGYPSCLAFGAAVTTKGEDPGKCPFLDGEGLDLNGNAPLASSAERDLELIRHLKTKIASHDFARIAPALGGQIREADRETLYFRYLGREVNLSKSGILLDGVEPEDPRDQILLYNYVFFSGNEPLRGEWIGMESMPNSISKIKTLQNYGEKPLAELFEGLAEDLVLQAARSLDGKSVPSTSASICLFVPVLPMVPQQILFWRAEPEDGFAASVKILYDRTALRFLDLESLVFTSERMADRFAELLHT